MNQRLKGKVALVTGAGRGIGAATARLFAREGARVVIVSRTAEELNQVAAEITEECGSGSVVVIPADVADETSVKQLFYQSKKMLGRMTILVNNAGIFKIADMIDQEVSDWDRTIAVNLRGPFLCSREAFRQMKEAGCGGSIVNVSSLAGIRGVEKFRGTGAYVASKHGMVGLTEVLAVEGKPFGIRVNGIAPGAVDTQMIRDAWPSFQAKTQPREIAPSILFLCDESQSGPLTGTILEVHCNP